MIWNDAQLNFNGQYTSNHAVHPTQGSSVADLLLGLPNQAFGGIGATTGDFKMLYAMPYIQDDWKVTPKLTVNLGLRYDFYQAPKDGNGRSSVYVPATNTIHPGTYRQEYKNFAPRVGFAYSPDNKTVLRAGYGIYYSIFMFNEIQFLLAHPPNYTLEINTFGANQVTPIANVFTPPSGGSALSPFTTGLTMPTPMVQQWNFAVQRALGRNWSATLTYLGNKATHLQQRINPNQAALPTDPANPSPISTRRPYQTIGDVYEAADVGWANYNGLQAELSHRFSNGLSFDTNYVWSRAMDTETADNQNPRFGTNVGLDYGPSDFNRTHVFKLSGVYELPFGPGKAFAHGPNWVSRQVIGGWQVSGITTWQSGTPFSIYANDFSDTGAYHNVYANQVCGSPYGVSNQSVLNWFNPSCFAQPGPGELGSLGRNALVGPRVFTLDVSAAKNFAVVERATLQFRSDFINLLNHPIWAFPAYSQNVVNPNLGQASQVGNARVIQLSLKATF